MAETDCSLTLLVMAVSRKTTSGQSLIHMFYGDSVTWQVLAARKAHATTALQLCF